MKCVPGLCSEVVSVIEDFIRQKVAESGASGVVLGLSGGVDSSTVAYLAVNALGPDRVLGLIMPSSTTPRDDLRHARTVADELGIESETIDIDPIIESLTGLCSHNANELALANLKPRARMVILYYHANSLNRLVAGTGNRTELLLGYFTKYGDGGVDMLPIGGLYKGQVRELAGRLGVPPEIIKKPPTAGLWHGQTDEEELGMKYDLLDELLCLLVDRKLPVEEVASTLSLPPSEVERIARMVKGSEHKLKPPEVLDIWEVMECSH